MKEQILISPRLMKNNEINRIIRLRCLGKRATEVHAYVFLLKATQQIFYFISHLLLETVHIDYMVTRE